MPASIIAEVLELSWIANGKWVKVFKKLHQLIHCQLGKSKGKFRALLGMIYSPRRPSYSHESDRLRDLGDRQD